MITGDGIMLGAGGETASIFVTGLSETDTVTATHKILKKVPNPASVVPDGYTQLEYIESAGTQYIDTGISVPHESLKVVVQFSTSNTTQDAPISGYAYSTWGWSTNMLYVNNNQKICVNGAIGPTVVAGTVYEVEYSNTYFKINGATTNKTFTGYVDGYNNTVFYGNGKRGQYKLYFYKLYNGSLLVRDYVPAKRNSDGLVGLYDLVSNTFFGNSGTGTFVAGAEIPQYIDEYVDGKTIVGKWTQKPNPAYVALPDGYTQLEYIESTGTQYIQVPAPTVTNGFIVEFSFYSGSQPSGYYPLFVSLGSNGFWLGWLNGSFIVRMADNKDVITTSFTTNKWIDAKVVYDGSTVKLFFDGNQVGSATATFANGGVNTYFCYDTANKTSFRLGEFEFCVGGTVIYHYVPCKNGSNSVGLYDLVTETFYGNSGTGTFTAGSEVPQTIDGFEIAPIKSYGTWTVSNADSTKSADVLIDAAAEFEVAL